MRLEAADLFYLAPELTIVIAAVLLSLIDLALPKSISRTFLGWLSIVGIAISAGFVIHFMRLLNAADPGEALDTIELLNHSYRVDDFANLFKLLLLAGLAMVIFMSIGSLEKEKIKDRGEFYYLFLPAGLGAMIMASSGDLITLYVGLELLSITSYILVAMRRGDYASKEAAFKYVVMGGIASAFILYGMSFLYGITGTTNLGEINVALSQFDTSFSALVYLSFFLMLAGFGFKIAAAPFHMWAPDVYQGSPTPVAAFLSVVSKAAGFAILFRIVYNVYFGIGIPQAMPIHSDVFLALMVLAAAAMILGNALALKQRNIKRLLAYSGVANAGYLLVPIGIHLGQNHLGNFSEMFFYLIVYYFMNLGAFAILMAVSHAAGHDEMSGFAGLYHRAPGLSIAAVIILLSLAGLPVTGGFMGKLYIILGTVRVQEYWLALTMILTSVVSFYYYFSIIRQMFLRHGENLPAIRLTMPLAITVWLCVIVTVVLGIFPQFALSWIEQVFQWSSDFFVFPM